MKARFVLGGVAACLGLVLVSVGFAAGGSTIANAPLVVVGQQNFGNTASMSMQEGYRREFWRLQLTSGDAVTINFSNDPANSDQLKVIVLSPDVTDYNVLRSSTEADATPQANGKGQLTYVARRSGTYSLDFRTGCGSFCGGNGAPFDFVAYVRHAVKLFIPSRPTVIRTGLVTVQVRNPDGAPITDRGLKVTLRGIWGRSARTLGRTTPHNGVATFKLKLPAALKGQTIKIRAIGSGQNYIGALSVFRAVRVR